MPPRPVWNTCDDYIAMVHRVSFGVDRLEARSSPSQVGLGAAFMLGSTGYLASCIDQIRSGADEFSVIVAWVCVPFFLAFFVGGLYLVFRRSTIDVTADTIRVTTRVLAPWSRSRTRPRQALSRIYTAETAFGWKLVLQFDRESIVCPTRRGSYDQTEILPRALSHILQARSHAEYPSAEPDAAELADETAPTVLRAGWPPRPRQLPLRLVLELVFNPYVIAAAVGMMAAWVFGGVAVDQMDCWSPFLFLGARATATAAVTSSEITEYTEFIPKPHTHHPIYATAYLFEAQGRTWSSVSYSEHLVRSGTHPVEYVRAAPAISRLRGMRRRPISNFFGSSALGAAVYFIGLLIISAADGFRRMSELRHGRIGVARLDEWTRCETRRGDLLYQLTYRLRHRARDYWLVHYTPTEPTAACDEEPVFYPPSRLIGRQLVIDMEDNENLGVGGGMLTKHTVRLALGIPIVATALWLWGRVIYQTIVW